MNILYKNWTLKYWFDVDKKLLVGFASHDNKMAKDYISIEVSANSLYEIYDKNKLNTLERLFKQKVDKRIEE